MENPQGPTPNGSEILPGSTILVKWRDVLACSGWETEVSCPLIATIGFFVSIDKDTLIIGTTIDYDDFMNNTGKPVIYGLTAFPKGCVTSVDLIQKPSVEYG
jgi:hypothetical protein|tara:strand:+ start:442 stop:747 length:306 start_codon:yes stop_codon:yes gene_type:complete